MALWSDIIYALDAVRRRVDPIRRMQFRREFLRLEEANRPYEAGTPPEWIPTVLSPEETLRRAAERHCSLTRFGDGEFRLILGESLGFQHADRQLGMRLAEILNSDRDDILVCLSDVFGSLAAYTPLAQYFWRLHLPRFRSEILPRLTHRDRPFGNAFVSRPYMDYADKSDASLRFGQWKRFVTGKRLLVVEGRFSRLGIGNDLFDGAASIRRIWCPNREAFRLYDAILGAVKAHAAPDDLILLALGPTATVLAYDLAAAGYWAVDTGHLDIEYIWMRMGATRKVPIPGRYINESWHGQETIPHPGEAKACHVVAELS